MLQALVEAALQGQDQRLVTRCDVGGIVTAFEDFGVYDPDTLRSTLHASMPALQLALGGTAPPSFLPLLKTKLGEQETPAPPEAAAALRHSAHQHGHRDVRLADRRPRAPEEPVAAHDERARRGMSVQRERGGDAPDGGAHARGVRADAAAAPPQRAAADGLHHRRRGAARPRDGADGVLAAPAARGGERRRAAS